jgi:hypothetical protein
MNAIFKTTEVTEITENKREILSGLRSDYLFKKYKNNIQAGLKTSVFSVVLLGHASTAYKLFSFLCGAGLNSDKNE